MWATESECGYFLEFEMEQAFYVNISYTGATKYITK